MISTLPVITDTVYIFQGQLMQMTMMTPPNFNNELHYLNKEDRLLRWLLVKHRDVKLGPWSEGVSTREDDPLRGDYRNYRVVLHDWVYELNESSADDDDDENNEG